jgi:two-component system, NarL family, response regulator DesR
VIEILLAEDMHAVRAAFVALLNLEPDMRVVAEVAEGTEIVPVAVESKADVAVLDIDLPGMDGLTAAAALHATAPRCRTLILTALARPGMLHRALEAKVGGFIRKDARPEDLVAAIRSVHAGRRVLDPELTMLAWDAKSQCPLTHRELDVVTLLAQGSEAVEIGRQLHLSAGTVRNYLTQIVWKVGARNRVDAVRIVREAGWI